MNMRMVNADIRKIAFVLLLTVCGQFARAEEPLTLEEIISLKRVTTVRMSPDGDRIAYLLSIPRQLYKDDDGRPYRELHVVDFDGNSTPYVTGKIDITDIAWAPDGRSIYFVSKRDPEAKFNSIWRIPIELNLASGSRLETK